MNKQHFLRNLLLTPSLLIPIRLCRVSVQIQDIFWIMFAFFSLEFFVILHGREFVWKIEEHALSMWCLCLCVTLLRLTLPIRYHCFLSTYPHIVTSNQFVSDMKLEFAPSKRAHDFYHRICYISLQIERLDWCL